MPAPSLPPRRATQSLIGTIHYCLRHPSLLGCELLWRWAFGLPALWLVWHQLLAIVALIPATTLTQLDAVTYQPVQAASIVFVLAQSLVRPILHTLEWLVPLLMAGWIVVSAAGRWLVLWRTARIRPDLIAHPPQFQRALPIAGFQALRIVGLTATFALALGCMRMAANSAFADAQNPNLVFFFTIIILATLGMFTVWAVVSWTVSIGPLMLVRDGGGFLRSAVQAVRLGRRPRNKLIEINLVLGITKLAALVLEMVFSAIPMPFETATTPGELHMWWAMVAIGYLAVNDFFQVVRLVAMLETLEIGSR